MDIDLEAFKDVIGLAGDTGVATNAIANSVETIKGLFGTSKSATDPNVELAMSELMLQVSKANATNAMLVYQLTELKSALEAAQAVQTDFDRYELWQAPAGALVHRLKESDTSGQPSHFLCPNCMEQKRKSILQGEHRFDCNHCGAKLWVYKAPESKARAKWANRH
jgi:hypothetical protein